MNDVDRRTLLKLISSAPVAAGFVWTEAEALEAPPNIHGNPKRKGHP
jgi:hypothetical protein